MRQLAAVGVVLGHEQHFRACQGERHVPLRGVLDHVFGGAAEDPAAGGVVSQHAGVAGPKPQRGLPFPADGEPDRRGQLEGAESAGEQVLPPPLPTGCSCCRSPARTSLAPRSAT
jgi:hypothetical protein